MSAKIPVKMSITGLAAVKMDDSHLKLRTVHPRIHTTKLHANINTPRPTPSSDSRCIDRLRPNVIVNLRQTAMRRSVWNDLHLGQVYDTTRPRMPLNATMTLDCK